MFFDGALIIGGWWMVECCRKSYIEPAEIAFFSSRNFSRNNKHDTFWQVLSTKYLYTLFLWAIAITDFSPLEIYKNLDLPLSPISFAVNSRASNHFYKYICFKYHTVRNYFFLLKYMLRFFIFKFDLNVKHSF